MYDLSNIDRRAIVQEALGWVDVPYKLKGKTKEGTDCSQLVLAVYRNSLGLNLISDINRPFLASWLFVRLDIIPPEKLVSGDLVFYCREPRPKGRIATSTAIYIGDGKIVHASLRLRKVAIESILDYPGLLLSSKDPVIVEQWQEEIVDLYPSLTG